MIRKLALADEKTPPNTNTRRTAELAFKALDTDGSGGVNLDEFIKALERFGMHVCECRPPLAAREATDSCVARLTGGGNATRSGRSSP